MSIERDWFEYDISAPRERTTLVKGICGGCGRSIHRTPLSPAEPTEWRHDSSGHALSWTPQRHAAGPSRVRQHAHRWGPESEGKRRCEVSDCDSELLARRPMPLDEPISEKQAHVAASRRRGGEIRRQQTRAEKKS